MKRERLVLLSVLLVMALLCPMSIFAADNFTSMFADGKTTGQIRVEDWQSMYQTYEDEYARTSVVGGFLTFETAQLEGISLGAGLRAQSQLANHKGDQEYFYFWRQNWTDPTNRTKGKVTDDDGIATIGEAFVRYNKYDTKVTVGRQFIDTPYMNPNEGRTAPMPICFQGLGATNTSLKGFQFDAGYFTKYADWWDEDFVNMISSDVKWYNDNTDLSGTLAGIPTTAPIPGANPTKVNPNAAMNVAARAKLDDKTRPAEYLGATWTGIRGLNVNAWYYAFTDVMSIWSPQVTYLYVLNKDFRSQLDVRYMKEDGIGSELVGAKPNFATKSTFTKPDIETIDTGMFAAALNNSYKQWKLNVNYQKNGDQDIIEPYGHRRMVTQTIEKCVRAEEDCYLVHLQYDWSKIWKLKGFNTIIRAGFYDNPDTGRWAAQDFQETDFILLYLFPQPSLRGLTATVTYAVLNRDDDEAALNPQAKAAVQNTDDQNDLRFTLQYKF